KLLREDDLINAVKTTLPKVWNVLWSTAGMVLNIIGSLIGVLYLFFMLMDYELYAEGWAKFVPKRRRAFARQLVGDIERGMSGYFRGQALIALSNCVMFTIGFLIIGFPLPVALGCFIGIISFVPYLQVVGILPATVLALLKTAETGANFWWLICSVLLVYIVVQILQDTIFTPKIMGKIMGLPPAIILFSLSVWGFALGIVGLIIALPVTTLMVSYYKRYVVGEEETAQTIPELPDAPEYPSTSPTP
ncbi:MAG: AI-2E family transporter, partial [Bacteroidales bacterium]